MSWYKTGTIGVTNGSTTVTGTGTAWVANVAIGESLVAPDGRLYEVTGIAADTSLTLGSAYLGSTASAQAYSILPSQSYIRDLAAQTAALVNAYSAIASNAGAGKFADGSLSAPGISFVGDTDTGIVRLGANDIALVANGQKVRISTAEGVVIEDGHLRLKDTDNAARVVQFLVAAAQANGTITLTFPSGTDTLVGATATQTLTNKTLTSPVVAGGAINSASVGATIPASGAFTTLSAAGNVTLGDAPTDTVTVAGRMGIGGRSAQADELISIGGTPASGTTQTALNGAVTVTSAATTKARALVGAVTLPDSTFTCATVISVEAQNASKGSGATITNQHGVYVNDQTNGSNNYGITLGVSSGTNKWNVYASGTAANYFAGNVVLGASVIGGLPSATHPLTIAKDSGAVIDLRANYSGAVACIFGRQHEGTVASPSASPANKYNLSIIGQGYGTTSYQTVGRIRFYSGETISDTSSSGFITFETTPVGSVSPTQKLVIGASEVIFNDPGNDYDFRVESDTNTHAIFLDAGNSYIGINNAAPTVALDVTGAIAASTTLKSGGYTVATLPAGSAGARAYVTDATSPTWRGSLTGGGAVVCPVFHNGASWLSA